MGGEVDAHQMTFLQDIPIVGGTTDIWTGASGES